MNGGSPFNMILELPFGLLDDVLVTIVTILTNHKASQHCVKGAWEKKGKEEGKKGRKNREGEGGRRRKEKEERREGREERGRKGGKKEERGR